MRTALQQIVFLSILSLSIVFSQTCYDDDFCNIERTGNVGQACLGQTPPRNFNDVAGSKMFVSDMTDNTRLITSITNARNWITSVARSSKGNDSIVIADGGAISQLHIDFNNWCCLNVDEGAAIAKVLSTLEWTKITVRFDTAGCVKVWAPDAEPQPYVTIGVFASAATNPALFDLASQIERSVSAFRIPIVNPHPQNKPFFLAIANVHSKIFPVADALNYLTASSTTDPNDQQFGTATIQAISFNGVLYYAKDKYIPPATQDCPDCNTSTGTMIAAILIFIFGMGIFYGCYYYREIIKANVSKFSHRATEMARKAIKPHGQTDSADA